MRSTIEIADENLDYYRDLLVAEARIELADIRSRNDFLIAVGARAMMNISYTPQEVGWRALNKAAGVLAVEAVHPEMAEWTPKEWAEETARVFAGFKPRAHEVSPDNDSFVGYLQVSQQLRTRGRYPMRRALDPNSEQGKQAYIFVRRGESSRRELKTA